MKWTHLNFSLSGNLKIIIKVDEILVEIIKDFLSKKDEEEEDLGVSEKPNVLYVMGVIWGAQMCEK